MMTTTLSLIALLLSASPTSGPAAFKAAWAKAMEEAPGGMLHQDGDTLYNIKNGKALNLFTGKLLAKDVPVPGASQRVFFRGGLLIGEVASNSGPRTFFVADEKGLICTDAGDITSVISESGSTFIYSVMPSRRMFGKKTAKITKISGRKVIGRKPIDPEKIPWAGRPLFSDLRGRVLDWNGKTYPNAVFPWAVSKNMIAHPKIGSGGFFLVITSRRSEKELFRTKRVKHIFGRDNSIVWTTRSKPGDDSDMLHSFDGKSHRVRTLPPGITGRAQRFGDWVIAPVLGGSETEISITWWNSLTGKAYHVQTGFKPVVLSYSDFIATDKAAYFYRRSGDKAVLEKVLRPN
jgi:hypothetical protein